MYSSLCIAITAAFLAAPSAAIDCNNNSCSQTFRKNVCLSPIPTPAPACGRVLSTGFSHEEENMIVNTYNMLRQYVAAGNETRGNPGPQPPASNMQTMTWDDELADIAQRWVNQCKFGHDECGDIGRFPVGRSIASTMTNGTQNIKPSDIITMWYDDVTNMDRNTVNKYHHNPEIGHYTQLVWANTNRVGCGRIVYAESGCNPSYMVCNTYYMACTYRPSGNVEGEPVYKVKA